MSLRPRSTPVFVLWMASTVLAPRSSNAQIAINPGDHISPQDHQRSQSRHDRLKNGSTLEEFVERLKSPDPQTRRTAVKSLGDLQDDPRSLDYLMQAVDDPDGTVAATALEMIGRLGRRRADAATQFLTERLFFAGASEALRHRVLLTLGEVGDANAAPRILEFVKTSSDPDTRGTGIRVIGEIGDAAMRGELESLAVSEQDPRLREVISDAVAKIAARSSPPEGGSMKRPAAAVVTEGTSDEERRP